jgi:hydroxylaminobenzene mutase
MQLSWVAQVGLIELAFGALSGWLMVVVVDKPQWLTRVGVRAPGRIRQAHIDFIMMGILLIAVGLAVPELATLWQVLLVGSAWLNPTLFLPVAMKPELKDNIAYRGLATLSFLSMSAGTVAAAVTGLSA